MSDAKFTPGPWECAEVSTSIGRAFRIGKGAMLEPGPRGCCIIYDDYGHGTNERSANARLISAAPDLYEALAALVEINDPANFDPDMSKEEMAAFFAQCDKDTKEALELARAALAKARGEA